MKSSYRLVTQSSIYTFFLLLLLITMPEAKTSEVKDFVSMLYNYSVLILTVVLLYRIISSVGDMGMSGKKIMLNQWRGDNGYLEKGLTTLLGFCVYLGFAAWLVNRFGDDIYIDIILHPAKAIAAGGAIILSLIVVYLALKPVAQAGVRMPENNEETTNRKILMEGSKSSR